MKKLTVFILLIALLAFSAQVNAEMIVVYYSEAGAAKTGLSVTIDITDVADGSLDIDDGACTELANGWYKYDFSDDATKNYTWLADGGAGLCDPERYIEGNIYLTTAKVNAEVVDGLNVDTYAEPGQGALPLPATPIQMMQYPYKAYRNKTTQTASGTQSVFNDAGDTVDHKTTVTTSGGTTTKTEQVTGP